MGWIRKTTSSELGLTGSPGGHFRYSRLLAEIEGMQLRAAGEPLALLLVHVDGVADVNRRFGYGAGDEVLERCARRLADVAREQDLFVPVTPGCHALLIRNPLHESHAVLAAEKAGRVISRPFDLEGESASLRVHIGISLLPSLAATPALLLQQAEAAQAAARSRDQPWQVYSGRLEPDAVEQAPVRYDIEQALHRGEFEMHFQPKVLLATGRLHGAEALVRWNSPQLGNVPPGVFLPAIEQTQEVRPLLRFGLNAALRAAAGWLDERPDFRIAVNLSAGNLEDDDLVQQVSDALKVWHFPARQLVLEITESALMEDASASARVLGELRALGVEVSIDDFGTGYSSLAYLKTLPADELKIDRSFVSGVVTDETDRQLVQSVIQLGHAVRLKVVAEGIETLEVARTLAGLGCDIGQGYYYDRPLPASEFAARWITRPVTEASSTLPASSPA
ncbi:MAG: GGDEF domain-containing protein [Chromatiales bacterium]|nr:GGDEF domain-containing protein [Chromatiales bacterium]